MSVVIPAGAAALPLTIGALPPVHEVIVVVGPDQDTGLQLPRSARVIKQTRAGHGNAVACGAAAAGGDVVVTMAGDGSCDPADVPRFVAALRDGADVVHGSRYLTVRARVADLVLLWVMRVLFGCRVTDPGSGYRAFWRDTADRQGLPRVAGSEPARGDGPECEALLTVRATRAGLRVAELATTPRPALDPFAPPLLPAIRALVAEYRDRRRPTSEDTGDSIVVMTGATPGPETPVNAPQPPDRNPGDPDRTWPAPNQPRVPAARDRQNAGPLPGNPQIVDRRRGERRNGDRRRADFPALDRRAGGTAAPGDASSRRRWRDGRAEAEAVRRRAQDRPNLRVINGEGHGADGDRGHLRSV